jgi:hypothetical protein
LSESEEATPESADRDEEDLAPRESIVMDFSELKELSEIEAETAIYIAGAAVRKLMKDKRFCNECVENCISGTTPITVFSQHKDFTGESLLNTSLPLRDLAIAFEAFFETSIQAAIVAPQPRHFIISSFMSSVIVDYSPFACSKHHHSFVHGVLTGYYNTRLFHAIKLINAKLTSGKKKNELNKDKKLGM